LILCDYRELSNKDGQLIHQKLDEPPSVTLTSGDYLLRGNGITTGVERVTNTGLLADMESGRAVDKLERMAGEYDIVILIIEGLIFLGRDSHALVQEGGYSFKYYDLKGPFPEGADLNISLRRTRFHFHSIAEFLTSVCLRWVHRLEFTLSPSETAYRLKELDDYFSKGHHPLHLTRARPFNMKREDNLHEFLLTGLPGIGPERAKAIVEHFGKAPLAWTVSEKELSEVEGIGKTTARRLISVLQGSGEDCRLVREARRATVTASPDA